MGNFLNYLIFRQLKMEETREGVEKCFMTKSNLQVNLWWTEYVYEMFWDCLNSSGNVNMALRFMVDGIIRLRVENAILSASRVDIMINAIKFVLHVLECDPEESVP